MKKFEIIEILENSFSNKWRSLGGKMGWEIHPLLYEEFLIDEIVNSVNEKIKNSENYYSALRYQRVVLQSLSREFALILFLTSNEGENVNREIIIKSQEYFKINSKCKIHPCTKLFG